MLRSRDYEVAGTASVQMVTPKGGINYMHSVYQIADGRLAAARYVHDVGLCMFQLIWKLLWGKG